jgi:hypothetical protein
VAAEDEMKWRGSGRLKRERKGEKVEERGEESEEV